MPQKPVYTYDIIKTYASKKGVSIYFEWDDTSDTAMIGSPYLYERKEKILTIIICNLSTHDKPLVFELIRKIHDEGGLIWKETKKETLELYKEYSTSDKNKDVLEFFKPILDKDDFEALKMAYFIKSEMHAHHKVHEYKKDIRDKFGERGANIANLCTAGYFEIEFMPLFEKVSRADFDTYYELAVGKKARALFIHTGMSHVEIEEEFYKMVDKALKYHMNDFRVHGLGEVNVSSIKNFFNHRVASSEEKFVIKKRYETEFPTVSIEYIITF